MIRFALFAAAALALAGPAWADIANSRLSDNAYYVDDARAWLAMPLQMKIGYVAGVIDVFVRRPGAIFEGALPGPIAVCFRSLIITPEEIVQAVDLDYTKADERDYSPSMVVQGFVTDKIVPCVSDEMRRFKDLQK
jgi:hypothetical protein